MITSSKPWVSLEISRIGKGYGLFLGKTCLYGAAELSWVIGYADRNGLNWHMEEEKCICGHLEADHGRATVDTEKSCFRCGCWGFETQEPES